MMHHKFYFKEPQTRDEKDKVVDLADDITFLYVSMGNMISTDKPVFFAFDIDDNFNGAITVYNLFHREKTTISGAIEYGIVSGRLFKMTFSSRENFNNSIEQLKALYRQFNEENTPSMRRRNNSSFAKRAVEKIAEYINKKIK